MTDPTSEIQPSKSRIAAIERAAAAYDWDIVLSLTAEALVQPDQVAPALGYDLTVRERGVLALLVEGLSNAEIAEELVISVRTVKSHATHIYDKLGVSSRSQAVSMALKLDLVPANSD